MLSTQKNSFGDIADEIRDIFTSWNEASLNITHLLIRIIKFFSFFTYMRIIWSLGGDQRTRQTKILYVSFVFALKRKDFPLFFRSFSKSLTEFVKVSYTI